MFCPKCGSTRIIKNGSIHNKKKKYQCNTCRRQFVEHPENKIIDDKTIKLINKLLLERISMEGIVRVTGVSDTWLQNFVNAKFKAVSRQIEVTTKPKGRLTIECDEEWSYVGNKENKVWTWLAIDKETRECIGCFIGDRSRSSAQGLWDSFPPVYRQCAVAYTDFWEAYNSVFPKNRHRAVAKSTGLTNHIERLNNTFRQRISRLVRKTLSFSKNLANHIGAIWYFIHDYNNTIKVFLNS